jgi:hypothetical protein
MSREIVFILEPDTGRVTVESSRVGVRLAKEIERDLGQGTALNCARPISVFEKSAADIAGKEAKDTDDQHIYLFRLYHDSTVDGFGRRSVVQVAGCLIRCAGFIYSLRWEKYNMTHDRTEQRTLCNRSASRRLAEAFS